MRRDFLWGWTFFLVGFVMSDAGAWQVSRPDDFTRKDGVQGDLRAIAFADDLRGWAVGDNSLVLRTEDGGKTWVKQDVPARPTVSLPTAVGGPPAGGPPGFGGGGNVQLWRICILDANTAWIVGSGGALFFTQDGGKTWERSVLRGGSRLVEVCFVTPEIGFLAGDNSTLAKTTDGGKAWNPVLSGPRARAGDNRTIIEGLAFPTPEVGWAVGSSGMVRVSHDGGITWEKPESEIDASENLYGIVFTSSTEGWIVGQEATILHTVDGGKTWKRVKNEAEDGYYDLYDIAFVRGNPQKGWICGDGGVLLATSDGGKTWKKERSGVSEALYGVATTPSGRAFAVGAWGVILQTP